MPSSIDAPVTVRRPDDLTPAWLEDVLRETDRLDASGRVVTVATERIGTGQLSENHRIALTYEPAGAGPASLVLKVASSDENGRRTGAVYGAYGREVSFYRELSDTVGGPLAACLHAVIEPETGWFTLVLEDLHPAEQGDQIAGCSIQAAEAAVDGLAAVHAARWDDEALATTDWLTAASPLDQAVLGALLPGFLDRYGHDVDPAHLAVAERFIASLDGWAADRPRPFALQHGDYRLDNLLFTAGAATAPVVVDWQTVSYGPALLDLAYLLGGSLTLADRRTAEEALVRRYHERLGVPDFSWEECWRGYRHQSFHGVLMAISGAMLSERTQRGDELFTIAFARHAQQVLDLDAIALLPPAATPEPLAVAAGDEGRHAPDEEELFNESWYGDFFTAEGGIAGYARLGLYPNRDEAWLHVALVRAGHPTLMAGDVRVPFPAGDTATSTSGDLTASFTVDVPLERFSVRAEGVAGSHADPATALRGEPGEPVRFALDLTWETTGTPFQYRITTRYEIPCRVTGTVTIGDETLTVDGAGQRDHSWGTRDWWAMDWCWSAGQLDDGTAFHGTEVRLPDQPRLGIGYVQDPDGTVHELARFGVRETVRADGLIGAAAATLAGPHRELELELTAIAHGPLSLASDDGRVVRFPRACYRVTTADGRTGLAWTEFNLNER